MSAAPAWLPAAMMIASGSIHAVVNAILKGGSDKLAGRAVIDGTSALILLPALAFVPLPHGAWGWIAASAALHCLYLFALVKAFESSDFSAAYPILRGSAPLLTATLAIGLFGEAASPREIAGIALIGGAVTVLVVGRHVALAGLGWALLTGVTIAVYTVIDAQGVRAAPSPASFTAWLFVVMGLCVVTSFGLLSRGRVFRTARSQWRPGVAAGALSILTYGLALQAFALGPTAPLAALRETGMVTALAISVLFLGERVTWPRAASVLGILGGAALILTR
ncbi:EamA family transporter [Sphingomonas canadensis]|uniref:EamA family transporter n=1 Tax=Sphingomonas canadensis TaxID=1219257 RepID=A0ABW3H2I8_9SPHN|nr:DMT family transporter [Sphingomonas canadensis]MCW3835169.1 DMT family transporter [Sphingomonas canadensis]